MVWRGETYIKTACNFVQRGIVPRATVYLFDCTFPRLKRVALDDAKGMQITDEAGYAPFRQIIHRGLLIIFSGHAAKLVRSATRSNFRLAGNPVCA